jgi:hypothetical protein
MRIFRQMKNSNSIPMHRGRFLRGILGSVALLGSGRGALSALPAPVLRRVPVLEAFIRGFQYHDGPGVIGRMQAGDALQLVREPGNDFDENAIAVHWNGHHLGYLPREENNTLARMMDRGVPLVSTLTRMNTEAEPWAQCAVIVELMIAETAA